jgi:hypothetical protein
MAATAPLGIDPAEIVLGPDDEPPPLSQCQALLEQVAPDDPEFSFVVDALRKLLLAGFDARDPALVERAIEVGRRQCHTPPPKRPSPLPPRSASFGLSIPFRARPRPPAIDVVYYMRMGNRCKIGYSANLRTRLGAIRPEELLAVERGPMALERQRHREFQALRTHGEWFELRSPLTEHIDRLHDRALQSEELRELLKLAPRRLRVRPT